MFFSQSNKTKLKLTFSQIRVSVDTTLRLLGFTGTTKRLASITTLKKFPGTFDTRQSSFRHINTMFPHDTAQYPVVFVNTQRRLDIFVHWILECVRYTAKDNVRIELDPIVLGHVM